MARLCGALIRLRDEIDLAWPYRDRTSDGWIGDAAHQLTISDHNPDANGVVHALDVDADGIPAQALVDHIVRFEIAGPDPRLTYVIYNRAIWRRKAGWRPERYTGSNPHISHIHFSAAAGPAGDVATGWNIPGVPAPAPQIPAVPARGSRTLRLATPRMAGDDVLFVQHWIGGPAGPADGVFGPRTELGVKWYQRLRGIAVDGIVGPQTWRQMGVRT